MRNKAGLGYVVALATAVVMWCIGLAQPRYGDLYWQIPEGREILAGHFPTGIPYAISAGRWIDHEWLFEAIAAWLWMHGAYALLVLACTAAYAALPFFIYRCARTLGSSDFAAGAVALLAAAGESGTNPNRPQTFVYYLLAIEVALLWSGRAKPWQIFAIAILWANLHASAVVAVAVPMLFAAGRAIEQGARSPAVRTALFAASAAFAGTLLTPNFLSLWHYALRSFYVPAMQQIAEWQPLTFSSLSAWLIMVPALALLVFGGLPVRRDNALALLLGGAFLFLTLRYTRQAALLVPATYPVFAGCADRLGVTASRWFAARSYNRAAIAVPMLCIAMLAGVARAPAVTLEEPSAPWTVAADIMQRNNVGGNTFATYAWASYLHFRGLPVQLLIDSHGDPYDRNVWSDAMGLTRLNADFAGILARYRIAVVATESTAPLAQGLRHVRGWRLVEDRDGVAVFEATPIAAKR